MRIRSQYVLDVPAGLPINDLQLSQARFDRMTQVPDFAKMGFSAIDWRTNRLVHQMLVGRLVSETDIRIPQRRALLRMSDAKDRWRNSRAFWI
jgi:hypothetical protein